MTAVEYGFEWNELLVRMSRPMSEDEARARHEAGEQYAALWRDGDGWLTVTLVLSKGYIAVEWIGPHGLPDLRYTFEEQADGRWFLSVITAYDYVDDPDPHRFAESVTTLETISYDTDGTLWHVVEQDGILDKRQVEGVPLDINWEPGPPAFGDYGRFTRYDREQPPATG